jgi:hypothetical protein
VEKMQKGGAGILGLNSLCDKMEAVKGERLKEK